MQEEDTVLLMQKQEEAGEEEEDDMSWFEWIPLGICIALFVAILIYLCVDWRGAMKYFDDIIRYTREHPFEAVSIIVVTYILLIIFCMPITQMHILVAFAYCKVFHSFIYGLLFATWVIYIGCILGAIAAYFLGRFLFANYIRKRIHNSKSPTMKKFRVIDNMFITDGILLVALLRLIFIPFGLACYFLAVTSVSFCDYFLGTLFYLFKIILIALLGCSLYEASEAASDGNDDGGIATPSTHNPNEIILLVFEVLVTIGITIWLTCWAK